MLQALSTGLRMKRMIDVPFLKLLLGGLKQRGVQDLARQASSLEGLMVAIENGDLENGVLPISQAIGLIKDLPTCQEVVERTAAEAEEWVRAVKEKITS